MTDVELLKEVHVSRIRLISKNGIQLLSSETIERLDKVVTRIESDEECRVVVVEAEGRTFIAGADINQLKSLDADSAEALAMTMHRLFCRIEGLKPVTIAAIHAACAGGGFELTLSCDLRIASSAARMGLPEVTLGVIPGWGGTVRATRLFGPAIAKRLILTGELLDADESLRLGLVDSVVADDEFRAAVDDRADLICQRSPNACRVAKHLIDSYAPGNLDDQLQSEARKFADCFRSSEALEGLTAFAEKRQPGWSV